MGAAPIAGTIQDIRNPVVGTPSGSSSSEVSRPVGWAAETRGPLAAARGSGPRAAARLRPPTAAPPARNLRRLIPACPGAVSGVIAGYLRVAARCACDEVIWIVAAPGEE